MQLGWIDFSKEDRQKAFDVINLLSEQGAVDELGIGVIRDAFANYFFPGTSTIQTRAKYFLIVPYMLREAVDGRYGKDANRVLRAIDSAEKDCGIRLLEADPKAEGVIGSRVLPKGWVARKPSDIYWNGIRTFGIFCDYGLSIPEYVSLAVKLKEQKSVSRLGNRNDDAEENDKDDSDAGDIGNIRFWNLPIYHDDWRDNLTIELTQEEAFYLDKQIQKSTKGSLLEYVLKNRIDLNEYDDFASLTAELSEKVGEKLAYMMKLACDFNNLVYMARVRYNVMLSEDENTYANDEWSRLLPDIRHNATVDLDAVFGEFQLINPRAKSFLCGIQAAFIEILQLSEFYEITARSGDDTIRRIIMIPTSGFPDDRESAAVNSVVKDRASFVEYIAFVLGDDYVASMLEGKQMGESGFFANSSDAMPALYEKMLKTSVEGPERIKDIGYVLKMVTDKDIIPDEFRELYETFCNTLKIRR